jgi:Arc/MetJ-type ribon-helix-helix transcriptional regulator
MVKTTIYLPEQTKRRLTRAAARRHRSEAELIREAIDRLLRDEAAPRRPALGIFDSGDPSFAERTDETLAAGFGGDAVDW